MFHALVDSIIGPISTILQTAVNYLNQVALVAGRGINLEYYLGPVVMLGQGWQMLIGSIISSAFLLLMVLIARKGYSLYLALKEGVKWW